MRSRLALLALLPLAAAAAACSDDDDAAGSTKEFCADFAAAEEVFEGLEGNTAADLQVVVDTVEEISFPAELSDDAAAVEDGMNRIIDLLEENDDDLSSLSDEDQEALTEEFQVFTDSSRRIDDYAELNCETDEGDDDGTDTSDPQTTDPDAAPEAGDEG